MFHEGVCAFAAGSSIVDAPIEMIKNIAIAIAVVFLEVCMIFFSFSVNMSLQTSYI
jgi:hypothetical protein